MADILSFSSVLNLVYFASFFVLFLYGQRLQSTLMLVNVRRSLNKLDRLGANARQSLLSSMQRYDSNRADVETRLDRVTSSFAITPVSLDPAGIIGQLDHVLDTYAQLLRTRVQRVAPRAQHSE